MCDTVLSWVGLSVFYRPGVSPDRTWGSSLSRDIRARYKTLLRGWHFSFPFYQQCKRVLTSAGAWSLTGTPKQSRKLSRFGSIYRVFYWALRQSKQETQNLKVTFSLCSSPLCKDQNNKSLWDSENWGFGFHSAAIHLGDVQFPSPPYLNVWHPKCIDPPRNPQRQKKATFPILEIGN